MASTKGAEERIKYLLGEGPYRATPKTLSKIDIGDMVYVRSYGMLILGVNDSRCIVVGERSTATTNRHIRAAYQAVTGLGYKPRYETTVPAYHSEGEAPAMVLAKDGAEWN